jgi:hypothetical protein
MLSTIMRGADNTVANVALPHIQGSLSAAARAAYRHKETEIRFLASRYRGRRRLRRRLCIPQPGWQQMC